jgi:hypothetical protein
MRWSGLSPVRYPAFYSTLTTNRTVKLGVFAPDAPAIVPLLGYGAVNACTESTLMTVALCSILT